MTALTRVGVITACLAASIYTPQQLDTLSYGRNKYAIHQTPMTGLWYYGDGELPKGMTRPPKFDFVSTANWGGYDATWEIRNSKLWLSRIKGRIGGKAVRDNSILIGEKFPVAAMWFSGKIYLPVGDHDEDSGEYESVIIFEIDRGDIKGIGFRDRSKLVYSWNGL